MNREYTAAGVAWRIWMLTAFIAAVGIHVFMLYNEKDFLFAGAFILFATIVGSIPSFLFLFPFSYTIKNTGGSWQSKFLKLLLLQLGITACYGLFAAVADIPIGIIFNTNFNFIFTAFTSTLALFACSLTATFLLLKIIHAYFSDIPEILSYNQVLNSLLQNIPKNNFTMETTDHEQQPGPQFQPQPVQQSQSNKLLIKGLITGVLILLMLVPTLFIKNLIEEREQRQKEVVKEVSSKWAERQTISGPYLAVPYNDTSATTDGKIIVMKKQLFLLANELNVEGKLFPEERPRSIYKVLLYKSDVKLSGSFKPKWPVDINTTNLDFANAKLCFGISDFKGIEEEIHINFNNQELSFSPGLPTNIFDEVGLSVPVSLDITTINNGIPFRMQVKLKGSEQMHFMPLGANCKFTLGSAWPSPSFDGNCLPNERQVTATGFVAKWNFNQANLPYGTVIKDDVKITGNLAFGVSMVQPADQYDKTMRSVKYAILFIGLTFALFFIIEIMQRKPLHPVQYVLVGLALVIFYTLLLSIGEYLLFDLAYLIAATATVSLIALYAQGHFKSWKTTSVFVLALGILYGFIFILIRLEDTALLVGSIGLFIVLALVMYGSRRINWYGKNELRVDS